MNERELRAELDEAYKSFEAADAAGDRPAAKEIKDYAVYIEGRINSLRQTERRPALDGTQHDEQPTDPALAEEIEKSARELDDDDDGVKLGDYSSAVASSFANLGANFFSQWAAGARQEQTDLIEQLESYERLGGDPDDPKFQEQMARLRAKVERGEEIKPTFYGAFIRPWLSKKEWKSTEGVGGALQTDTTLVTKSPAELITETAAGLRAGMSKTAQEKIEKPFFNENSGVKFQAGDPASWFDGTAMPWEDLDAFLLALAGNSVQLSAAAITSRIAGTTGAMAKGRALRRAGVTNPTVVRAQSAATAGASGVTAGSATEYVMVRDAVHSDIATGLEAHWDNENLWAQNPRYQEMVEAGWSTEYSKQIVTDEIARTGGQVAGIASAILGAPMNTFWGKLGIGRAASRSGAAVKGALGESFQEGVQETVETLTSNVQQSQIDPTKPLTAGLMNAFFGGAALGMATGGALGLAGGGDRQVMFNKDQKRLKKRGWDEWVRLGNERSKLAADLRDPSYMETRTPQQRVEDFERLEDLEYREAKAYLKMEPKVRQMQKKYGTRAPAELRRTDIFAARSRASVHKIDEARAVRGKAEDRVATERQMQMERDEILRQVEQDATVLADLKMDQENLKTVQAGGVINEEMGDDLQERGFGRWTNKAKDKFVLTAAGRARAEVIENSINVAEQKIASGFAGPERREPSGEKKREKLAGLSVEELDTELHIDKSTGALTERALQDVEKEQGKAPAYAAIDVDSLDYALDTMGEKVSNAMMRQLVKAADDEGVDLYESDDGYVIRADTKEAAENAMQAIKARLYRMQPIKDEAGNTIKTAITWGVGTSIADAGIYMDEAKELRVEKGDRAQTGEQAPGFRPAVRDEDGELPIMSYQGDGPTEMQGILTQLTEIANATDEFTVRRREKLQVQLMHLHMLAEEESLSRAAEKMRQRMVDEQMTDVERARDWMVLPEDVQQSYELKAAEFWTPFTGEYISGQEVYLFERASTNLNSKIPSGHVNDFGATVEFEQSVMFQHLADFLDSDMMSRPLIKQLEKDSELFETFTINPDDMLVHVLAMRVSGYIGGEILAGGPTPFSGDVEAYQTIVDMYLNDLLPLMSLNTDPIMEPNFYRTTKKGDSIEVIVRGEMVVGIVVSMDNDSMRVRWKDGPEAFDPDTKTRGRVGRFSTIYGWQVSARAARGKKNYKAQRHAWVSQARLGRRYNRKFRRWETAKDHDDARRVRVKRNRTNKVMRSLVPAARMSATKNEMWRAQQVARNLLAGARNLPSIIIVNNIGDLPVHMQHKLVAHGNTGRGVFGMFDEENPANGIYIVAANIARNAIETKVPFETLVAEVVAHETIGHYGLRGFMGSDAQMDKWMDAIASSKSKLGTGQTIEQAVWAKGTAYGFVNYDWKTGKRSWRSPHARLLAAEEYLAEIAQHVIADTPGYQLAEAQKSILAKVVAHIKAWLIDHGFGSLVRLNDRDLYHMIWSAQNFVNNSKGWEYTVRTGRTLVPYMRDADIFQASILTGFYEAQRKSTKEEKQKDKANDIDPREFVPVFPEAASKNLWLELLRKGTKQTKDGPPLYRQVELTFTQIEEWLEGLTHEDLLAFGDRQALPTAVRTELDDLRVTADFDPAEWRLRDFALSNQLRKAQDLTKGGGIFVMGDDPVETLRYVQDRLNAHRASANPTPDEMTIAKLRIAEVLLQPVGKKAKISSNVIGNYLQAKSLAIVAKPANQYTDDPNWSEEDREEARLHGLDINPSNWNDVRPGNAGTGNLQYVPHGADRGRAQGYIFTQTRPELGLRGAAHGFNTEDGNEQYGSFMHMRYTEAFTLEGLAAYELLEVQADVFQEKPNAPFTDERKAMIEARDEAIRRLGSAGEQLTFELAENIRERWLQVYETSIDLEGESWIGLDQGSKATLLQNAQVNAAKAWETSVTLAINERATKQTEGAEKIWRDDARTFEYLDSSAVLHVLMDIRSTIQRVDSYIYDPQAQLSTGAAQTKQWERAVSTIWQNINADDAMQRIVTRPDLLKQVLDEGFAPLSGRGPYSDEEVQAIVSKLEKATTRITVTIPQGLVADLSSRLGGTAVTTSLGHSRDALSALGWNPDSLQIKTHDDGTVKVSGWGNDNKDVTLDTALKSVLVNQVEDWLSMHWETEETMRVNRVKKKIGQIESPSGEVADLDRAMREINYGEDNFEVEVDWMDSERYAEIKADTDVNNWQYYNTFNEQIEDWDLVDLQFDGETLDPEHAEYRALITIDEDGDADTEEAQEWLADKREELATAFFAVGEPGYLHLTETYEQEFRDRDFQDTIVNTFQIPIEWDEDGDPTDHVQGQVSAYTANDDADNPVDDTWNIYIAAFDNQDYEYDEESAQKKIASAIFDYYNNQDIKPPEGSQFFVEVSDAVAPDLRAQLTRLDRPDFADVAKKINDAEFESHQMSGEGANLEKTFEHMVRFQRYLHQGELERTPLRDVWQTVAVKFAIADAIRKGFDTIVWQEGGASASRGGNWTGEWTNVDYIDWAKRKMTIAGNEKDVIVLNIPGMPQLIMEPGRMIPVIGAAATKEILSKADDPGANSRGLIDRIRILPLSTGGFVVFDRAKEEMVSMHNSAVEAEQARNEAIESARGDEPTTIAQGRVTSDDIGGQIGVAHVTTLPNHYAHTVTSGTNSGAGRIRGARTNYEITTPSAFRKLIKPFGGEVTQGIKRIPQEYVRDAVVENGARIRYKLSSGFMEANPNLRIESLGDIGFVVIHDMGMAENVLYPSRDQAKQALDRMLAEAQLEVDGIYVYEVKITSAMRDAFGFGNIPIMSKDKIKGNPILEQMAEKVGAVPRTLTLWQRWDRARKDSKARANQSIFDRFYGIKHAFDQAGIDGDDAYISARLTTSLDSQMRAVMMYGHPVWTDGIMQTEGKGLLDILAPIGKPEDLKAWSLYMVARRSKRLMEEGREALITEEEIEEGLKLGKTFPIFETVADEYAAFNKKVLDFAEEAGLIDPENRALWEHADYVPFYRVQDDRMAGPLASNIGIANQRNPIKQLKGGQAALGDIPTNIIQNITQLIDGANKNHAALLAVDGLKGTGTINKVPSVQADLALVPMDQVRSALVRAGLDPDAIPEGMLTGLQKMFVLRPQAGEGTISVMRGGKREYYQTDDKLLYDAMTMINPKQFGRWMGLFRAPKRLLTATVTLDPGFMMANYIRDLGSSYVQSRDVHNPFTHLARSVQGWKQSIMKDEALRTMMSAGAAFDSGYMNYGDPNSTARAIRKAMRKKGFRVTVMDTPAKLFEAYKELGSSFENANRVAVYNEAIAAGKSKKQAAFEAKDLMDFSMGGSNPVIQFLIQSVPFLGARLQGLHRMGRGFIDNPMGFTIKGMLLTMAGMALWFNYREDERYKKLEEWDKDTYYHWWIGDQHFRLPKPFEVGVIFNTWWERAFEYAYSDSDDAGKLLMRRFGFSLSETFALNPIAQTIAPAFESAFNWNFFTGRQIVDPYTEKRMPPEQFRPSTSPTFVEIARRLPEGLDKVSKKFRSPLHLENLYRGYFGTIGRYGLMMSDEVMRAALDYPSRPTMQPADWPVVGRFYRGSDSMPRRTKYEEPFYELVRKTEEIQGSLRFLERIGVEDRMQMITEEQEPYVGLSKDLEKARREISGLNKDAHQVWMDMEMKPSEKREAVNEIQEGKNAIYKAIWEMRPGAGTGEAPDEKDLMFLLDEFGVDDVAGRIKERAPATASLLNDISAAAPSELGALVGTTQ